MQKQPNKYTSLDTLLHFTTPPTSLPHLQLSFPSGMNHRGQSLFAAGLPSLPVNTVSSSRQYTMITAILKSAELIFSLAVMRCQLLLANTVLSSKDNTKWFVVFIH